ncbi:putative AC transposase, partial [Bienertia sinuspersici]
KQWWTLSLLSLDLAPTTESVADHEIIGSNIIADPESTSKRKKEEWIQIDEHRRALVWLHYEFWLLKGEDGKPDTKNAFYKYCREHKYKASSENEILKATLRFKLDSIDSHICFTCDCWSAITKHGYLTFTSHYVVNQWVLRSRILDFRYFPPPHTGHDIYTFVLGLLKEWGLEKMNVDFVSKLQYDVCTRWNSTYKMIKRCLEASKAIGLFATRESNFDYGLSTNEWEVVEFVYKFLEPFNDIKALFSGFGYPTANLYLLHVVATEK